MIELADAPKARAESDLAHGQGATVDQRLGEMRPTHSGDLRGRNAEMAPEEAAKLSLAEAYARRERLAVIVVERTVFDQAQRPRHHRRRAVPRGRPR